MRRHDRPEQPHEGEPALDELGRDGVSRTDRAGVDVPTDSPVDVGWQLTVDGGIEKTPQPEMLDVAGE